MAHERIRLNYSLHTLTLMLNLLCNRALLTDNVSSRRSLACREFFSLSREGISSKLGGQCFISLAIAYPFIFLLSLLKKKCIYLKIVLTLLCTCFVSVYVLNPLTREWSLFSTLWISFLFTLFNHHKDKVLCKIFFHSYLWKFPH